MVSAAFFCLVLFCSHLVTASVAEPHQIDADPDPTYHFDADPDPYYLMQIRIMIFMCCGCGSGS
jgi:hypothetical protein